MPTQLLKAVAFFFILTFFGMTANGQRRGPGADTTVTLQYEIDSNYVQPPDTTTTEQAVPNEEEDEEVDTAVGSAVSDQYFEHRSGSQGFLDSVRLRHLPEDQMRKLRASGGFDYPERNDDDERPLAPRPRKSFTEHPLFQTLLWFVILGGFTAVLIIYLGGSNIRIFRKSTSIAELDATADSPGDIFHINYDQQIQQALRARDFRLGTRLMFLKILKTLAERAFINYAPDATNGEYRRQLAGSGFSNEFNAASIEYEYAWYGLFDISEEKFERIKRDFQLLESKIGHR